MNHEQQIKDQARRVYIDKLLGELGELDRQADKADEVDQYLTNARNALEGQVRQLAQQLAQLQHRHSELLAQQKELTIKQQSFSQKRLVLDAKRKSLRSEIDQLRGDIPRPVYKNPAPKREQRPSHVLRQSGPEQRRCARLVIAVTVNLQSENNFYMGMTENLSEGGLFVATYELMRVGTEIDLVIHLPNESPVRTPAKVCWLRENVNLPQGVSPGMGVQFLSISEQGRKAILAFIRQRDPMFFDC